MLYLLLSWMTSSSQDPYLPPTTPSPFSNCWVLYISHICFFGTSPNQILLWP